MSRNGNTLLAAAVAAVLAAPVALADSARSTTGAHPGMQTSPHAGAAQTFNRLDSNNDGYISRAEAGLAPEVIVIFPVADVDKDDRLSQRELDDGMKNATSARGDASGTASAGATAGRSPRMPGSEGVYSPEGPAGGMPLSPDPAGRAGSGA